MSIVVFRILFKIYLDIYNAAVLFLGVLVLSLWEGVSVNESTYGKHGKSVKHLLGLARLRGLDLHRGVWANWVPWCFSRSCRREGGAGWQLASKLLRMLPPCSLTFIFLKSSICYLKLILFFS